MAKRIEVKAGDAEDSISVVVPDMTMKDARRRARHMASDAFARSAEMSAPFMFVGVYVDGELVWEV